MVENNDKNEHMKLAAGRGPAYPYISLEKAVERADQLKSANMARIAAPPLAIYKVWGWSGDHGPARQTMAALNHFGLIEYEGRGESRLVKLSPLAHRIVFDKIPNSKERRTALAEAALSPPVYRKLWDAYGPKLPPDVVIETFLVRDCGFNDGAAGNVIGGYRDTIEYAGLTKPDNMPSPDPLEEDVNTMSQMSLNPQPIQPDRAVPQVIQSLGLPSATEENDIKVLLDGRHIRVSAYVDLKGAKRLMKALKANMALLEDDEDDEDLSSLV